MGEILIHRDETNRVVGFLVRGVSPDTALGMSVSHSLRAMAASLTEYLHVSVETSASEETYIAVDRSDSHLDRELDAVLETLVIGLRLLERESAGELIVHEAAVGVEVL